MGLHSVAILKGAVEGDPLRHLASWLEWRGHLAPLLSAGLVTGSPDSLAVTLTGAGREFYTRHRLDLLPDGRANQWPADHPVLADALPALAKLGG